MPPKKSPCRFRQLDFVLQGLFSLSEAAGVIQGGNMATTDIGMPSVRGVQNNLMSYGAGVVSGLAYNLVSGFTGSGLIGGAISAAVAGSIASPQLGQMIAVNAGFRTGSVGMAGLGLGNLGMGPAPKKNGNGNGNIIGTI